MCLIGLVEHLAGGRDADEPGEAEGAAGHVLSEAFEAVAVAGRQADALVEVEPAVLPRTHLLDEGGLDPALIQQQAENLVLPEPKGAAGPCLSHSALLCGSPYRSAQNLLAH